MTCVSGEAQEACPSKKSNPAILELFGSGKVTEHWEQIESAVRSAVPDERSIPEALTALRTGELIAFGVWTTQGETDDPAMSAIIVTRIVVGGWNRRSALIYAMAGEGLDLDQWKSVGLQLEAAAKANGIGSLIALTDNPRILEIVDVLGWKTRYYCEKEIV